MIKVSINTLIITEWEELTTLEANWNSLWLRVPEALTLQTYNTALHSSKSFHTHSSKPWILTIYQNGQLVFLWALVRIRKGPFYIFKPLGFNAAETVDLLIDPKIKNKVYILQKARTIFQNHNWGDILQIFYVEKGSNLYQILPKSTQGFKQNREPYVVFNFQTTWEDYIKTLSKNTKRNYKRYYNLLSKAGKFEFLTLNPVLEKHRVSQLINWMFIHKRKWSNKLPLVGVWIFSPKYEEYLINIITDPNNIQEYEFHVLMINNQPLAVKLCAINNCYSEYMISTFDVDSPHINCSPGFLLDYYVMKHTFERSLNVRFGVGEEISKLHWTKETHELLFYLIPLSLKGRIFFWLKRLMKFIKN